MIVVAFGKIEPNIPPEYPHLLLEMAVISPVL